MGEASIPIDVLNPGQVFACIGFMEAADILLGRTEGVFDWSDARNVRFRLRAASDVSPVVRVLRFLEEASAVATVPGGSANIDRWNPSWGPIPRIADGALGYPFPDPSSPATLACILTDGFDEIAIDYWGDETDRDNVKFWAGAGGYPGAALARDALSLIAGRAVRAAKNPFGLAAPQTSSFRFDWRRDYIPIDSGFSLNAHQNIRAVGFPIVELLAAIGLTNARPRRPDRRDKLEYLYGIAGRAKTSDSFWLHPTLLRAALGGGLPPFPSRRFRMFLDWPGQEGQARAITHVTEESIE
jgi:CRISPR-associated protein Csx14